MFGCNKCGNDVGACTCPDIDQRLREASDSPHVMIKWCLTCDKHYARCRCAEPLFGVRHAGKTGPAVLFSPTK